MSASDDETILNSGDAPPSALPAGTRLGDYEIEKLLGAGAMGEVYLARQVRLDQRCALKILPEAFTKSADFGKRFEREGRSLAKLDHPNIVRVLYKGVTEGFHFLAMEYVPGGTLEDFLEKHGGRLPEKETRRFLCEILAALAYAHGEGVIHRDLKPANILIGKNGACKLADFGLALVAGEEFLQSIAAESATLAALGEEETLLSPEACTSKRFGDAAALVGTIDYMSPEVRAGRNADARSDLFAVGVVAYRMLTSRKPSVGRSKDPSKLVSGLDSAWDDWVFRCMEADPKERFQSATEALEGLPGKPDESSKIAAAAHEAEIEAPRRELAAEKREKKRQTTEKHSEEERKMAAEAEKRRREEKVRKEAKRENVLIEKASRNDKQLRLLEKRLIEMVFNVPVEGRNWTVPEYEIELVWIKPGTFTMGSPDSELGHEREERQYGVTLTKGYWLGKYEVTQGQWQAVMNKAPFYSSMVGPRVPVECVSWSDAMTFCKKLTEKEHSAGRLPIGYEYSLPTEAQWEYACRAGSTGALSNGMDLTSTGGICRNLDEVAWYDRNSGETVHPIGQKRPNAWGLHDMHGNVVEWCHDRYGDYPRGDVIDPAGPNWGTRHVARGGGWNSNALYCRSAVRHGLAPSDHGSSLGFRLALRSVEAERREAAKAAAETAMKQVQDANVPVQGRNWTVPEYGIELVWINPGTFTMGSPESESDRQNDEIQHRVTLTKGFWLGKYEVTQGQWQAVMGNNPSNFKDAGSNAPVEQVSWYDAMEFCAKLTVRELRVGRLPAGYEFSLPTEAQWEYACRAGTTTAFCYGNDLDSSMANLDGNHPYGNGREGQYRQTTVAVGSFPPNAWGLYDMHGNVLEWCCDWSGTYLSGAVTDPTRPSGASYRVVRGGSWYDLALRCRSAHRGSDIPDDCNDDVGFRLALRSVEESRRGAAKTAAETGKATDALIVDSDPQGAEVIDSAGKRCGVTPLRYDSVGVGNYKLTLKKEGCEDTDVSGEVADGKPLQLKAVMRSVQGANVPVQGRNWTVPEYGIELVWINPGTFTMGSPESESDRQNDEIQHRVTLTKGFWLGKYEVTQGQWQAVMRNNPSSFTNAGVNAPVEQVSWNDAMEFCAKLTVRELRVGRLPAGYEFSLPTEAQWEYACRAGACGAYGGNGNLGSMGWYGDNSGSTTHPVGQKQANEWGLYDMHGNVWEWCYDRYDSSYPGGSVTDPTGSISGANRVCRGGGCDNDASDCRSAVHSGDAPSSRESLLGFRLALRSVQ
jgi:formylglycine-generating enzyme required for sulfatase activity